MKVSIDINMKSLKNRFDKVHSLLYDNEDAISESVRRLLVLDGDRLLCSMAEVAAVLVEERGDFLSSDREVAAFAIALRNEIEDSI